MTGALRFDPVRRLWSSQARTYAIQSSSQHYNDVPSATLIRDSNDRRDSERFGGMRRITDNSKHARSYPMVFKHRFGPLRNTHYCVSTLQQMQDDQAPYSARLCEKLSEFTGVEVNDRLATQRLRHHEKHIFPIDRTSHCYVKMNNVYAL